MCGRKNHLLIKIGMNKNGAETAYYKKDVKETKNDLVTSESAPVCDLLKGKPCSLRQK